MTSEKLLAVANLSFNVSRCVRSISALPLARGCGRAGKPTNLATTLCVRRPGVQGAVLMTVHDDVTDLPTATGPMRTYVYRPDGKGDRRYPGLVLYSEIFQQTGPIRRLALQFAGHGFVVMVPEVYHAHEAPGTVLGYDDAGKNRGNAL